MAAWNGGSDSYRETDIDNGSDFVFDYICCICASKNKQNKHKEGVKYCIECEGYCCLLCVQTHASFPTLKTHKLVATSDLHALGLAPGPSETVRASPTERCPKHQMKIDKHCGKHDVVGCDTCISTDHRTCTDIHSIVDSINSLFNKSDVDGTKEKVETSKDKVANVNMKTESFVKSLDEIKKTNEENLETFTERIKSALVGFKEETQSKFENKHKEQKEEMETENEKAVELMKSIKADGEKIERAEGNNAQEFVCMKQAQSKIRELKTLDQQIDNKSKTGEVYEPNDYTDQFVEYFKKFNEKKANDVKSESNRLYAVKRKTAINVRNLSDDDMSCCIQGSCLTGTGSLLLADSNNNKLKRVDLTSLSVVDQCSIYRPEDVCCVSDTEAAVACYSDQVHFVSLGTQLTPTITIKLDQPVCCGIASAFGKLFITDWNKTVFVYDMNGSKRQVITNDDSGNAMFCETRKLAFCDSKRLYICDSEAGSNVVILDAEGKYIDAIKTTSVQGTYAVCGDGRGDLFVCGHSSHNVVQIGSCGTVVGEVLNQSSGLSMPRSMCFDCKTNTLVVTNQSNEVALFELQ